MGVGAGLYMCDVVKKVHVRYLISWWVLVLIDFHHHHQHYQLHSLKAEQQDIVSMHNKEENTRHRIYTTINTTSVGNGHRVGEWRSGAAWAELNWKL